MSSSYSGVPTEPGAITIPSDGDAATPATIAPPIKALGDASQWLASKTRMAYAVGPDADTTFNAAPGGYAIEIGASVGTRIYRLATAGAALGDRIVVYCNEAFAGEVSVGNADPNIEIPLFKIGPRASCTWAVFRFDGSAWAVAERGGDKVNLPSGGTVTRALSLGRNVLTTEGMSSRLKTTSFITSNSYWRNVSPLDNVERWLLQNGTIKFQDVPWDPETCGLLWNLDHLLVHGATLSSVVATVKAAAHASLPTTQMSLGVFRCASADPTVFTSLRSAGDFVTDAAADVTAYATAHNITATCDQNNVIDKSTYTYWVQFWDESGTNAAAQNALLWMAVNMSNVYAIGVK